MAAREQDSGLLEEVIEIRFPNKVTKGGRTLGVAALVAVGDGNGRVGFGYGKARGVPAAIEKAAKEARGDMMEVEMVGDTIAHEVFARQDSAEVMLKPASPGTGVKAGATVRAILEVLGVHNVLTKVHGSTNAVNVAKATMKALRKLRSVAEVARLRGVEVELHHPQTRVEREEGETKEAEAPEAAAAAEEETAVDEEAEAEEETAAAEAPEAEEEAPAEEQAEGETETEPQGEAAEVEAEAEAEEPDEEPEPEDEEE